MIKSLYQPQQRNIIKYIPYGSFWYYFTQGIPLILWITFLYTFKKIPNSVSDLLGKNVSKIPFYIIICIPFLIFGYNIYQSYHAANPQKKVGNITSASMPEGWGYCFTSKVTSGDINKGIMGFLDEDCIEKNQSVFRSTAIGMLNRYHYLNYILLLLIITFRWHTKYIKVKFNTIQCHVIGYSILFGVLATIIPLFSTFLIRGIWVVQTISIMLTMNISCFVLIIISFLKDFA